MRRRQPPPRLWLLTDERMGDGLFAAIERLPPGAGIVFRHRSLEVQARAALFEKVLAAARARDLTLVAAGPAFPGADGAHNRAAAGLRTASAHNLREIRRAERRGADLIFLSPVHPTRSHAGAATLGARRFARLARLARVPVAALGGMNETRFRELRGAYGWAGIDAWLD
jgi:thiamine-phosphate pyrophosphorylase